MVLDQLRLTFEDLVQYSPRHSSSQALPSPISPKPSECNFGWRDRWWLNKTSAQNLSLNYWGFTSAEEALRVSELSINRISARQRFINGTRQSIYQPETGLLTADCTWRAERNILFARSNILILVSESGHKIELAVTIDIAQKILNKIEAQLSLTT